MLEFRYEGNDLIPLFLDVGRLPAVFDVNLFCPAVDFVQIARGVEPKEIHVPGWHFSFEMWYRKREKKPVFTNARRGYLASLKHARPPHPGTSDVLEETLRG
jgi:hypothetical protein